MAQRNVYSIDNHDMVKSTPVNFKWQWNNNAQTVHNLHRASPVANPLEISNASSSKVGQQASAMNLHVVTHAPKDRKLRQQLSNHIFTAKNGKQYGIFTVEQLFQGGKVFQNHGSCENLMGYPSKVAKRKMKPLNKHDKLVGFSVFGHKFSLQPTHYFYDWIYTHALLQHPKLAGAVMKHRAFTDIFATKNTWNTQARSCDFMQSLVYKYGNNFTKVMTNPEKFKKAEKELNSNHPYQEMLRNSNRENQKAKQFQKGYHKNHQKSQDKIRKQNHQSQKTAPKQLNMFQQKSFERD